MPFDPTIEPLDATFGAIVTGVRLADLDDRAIAALHAHWLQYALLVFPGQFLAPAEQLAFARCFGAIEPINDREMVPVSNVAPDGTRRAPSENAIKLLHGNMGWHCDSTYMPVQAKGAVFSAEVVPARGGETGWADMRAAYDALDHQRRSQVDQLAAYHSLRRSQARAGYPFDEDASRPTYGFEHREPPLRPLVKAHPETGRRALVIGRHAYRIDGMTDAESEQLLAELTDQACQPPRVYHHRWSPGDAVIWDNRCLMHRSRPWDLTEPRVMWHTRIAGEPATESALNHPPSETGRAGGATTS